MEIKRSVKRPLAGPASRGGVLVARASADDLGEVKIAFIGPSRRHININSSRSSCFMNEPELPGKLNRCSAAKNFLGVLKGDLCQKVGGGRELPASRLDLFSFLDSVTWCQEGGTSSSLSLLIVVLLAVATMG